MKTKALATVAGLALAAGVVGCNNGLTDLNNNPNSPTSAPPGALFTYAARDAVGTWLGGGSADLRGAEFVAQQLGEAQYPQEDEYQRLQASNTAGLFDNSYQNHLEDLRKVIAAGQDAQDAGIYGPAMVLQTWSFDYLTDLFGDVPYSDALKGDSTGDSALKPKYDKQSDIYTGMFKTLTDAVTAMDAGGAAGLGGADPIYGGDLGEWEKFANSLHARLAMRIVNVDETTARAELKAAFTAPGGVIESNADNAELRWPGDGVYNNPWTDNFKGRDDHRMAKPFMDILVANNDPRLPIWAQPVQDSSVYANGYGGMPNGLSQAEAGTWTGTASRPGAIFWPGATSIGVIGSPANASLPSYLMTAAEVDFIKAEMAERGFDPFNAGQAKGFYEDGIRASMEQWGVTDQAAIDAYLAGPNVAYKGDGTGTSGDPGLKQIAVQKWLALFTDGSQAWFEWRRTCQPQTIVAGPAAIIPTVPRRYEYSTTEQTVNADNLAAAVADLDGGKDDFTSRMWWDNSKVTGNAPTYVDDATCTGHR
ncbi:MAG TPA: SusD/RagB family nutrient-binding outer membrane lipoprotein [Gemmatimonadaceae bacterium]